MKRFARALGFAAFSCLISCMVVFGIAWMTSASAQVSTPGVRIVPMGYCQLTSVDASTLISSCSGGIPAGSTSAYIVPEAQAIRYRDDGVAPTASVGQPLAVGAGLFYVGSLIKVRVISQTSGAKVNILFYRSS